MQTTYGAIRTTFANLATVKKTSLYLAYWTAYLFLFSLIEGLPAHDLFNAFAGELVSLPVKVLFVLVVVEKAADIIFLHKHFMRFFAWYMLLLVAFAFMLRLVDNAVILKFLLIHWKPEPLFSAAPFLYNAIKLQFLAAIPFCFRLYNYWTAEKMRVEQMEACPAVTDSRVDFIQVKCDRRMLRISFKDIYYFEAQGNYVLIYAVGGMYKTYSTFSAVEDQLPTRLFLRVHRSFIVSFAKIKGFTHAYLDMGHQQIPIGRAYQLKARSALRQAASHHQIENLVVK